MNKKSIQTLLIANRGEIACRVAHTAKRMGIRTVAVYSDADRHARHVTACDTAVHIGHASAKESYLNIDAVIQAALRTGCQAIHPGYGFLSENETFAKACSEHGIIFVGPPVTAIAAMGSKSAAKALMERAGVPLVPGYHGDDQEPQVLKRHADTIGYPVLIKASAGGGGKGMRVVTESAGFVDALESCKRESAASFGDDQVLVERYLDRPRHIEIQVFADEQGQCVALFERDCSVQRRHQKVLEEAPAPGMTTERRLAMGNAAVAAAKAVGYVGAGTVEFIADRDGAFYFMEMNTRLQVEHPVTEMITGLDLVQWQLRVAMGEPLPVEAQSLRIHGHSIEARIYAENPERGFLPSTGRLEHLRFPEAVEFEVGQRGTDHAAVRVDSGVRQGDAITPYYDPMIAKLIVWGTDRRQALSRMADALQRTEIVGVHSNVAFLKRLVASEPFKNADLDTGLIQRHHDDLFAPASAEQIEEAIAFACVMPTSAGSPRESWSDPWSTLGSFRLGVPYKASRSFRHDGQTLDVEIQHGSGETTLKVGERTLHVSGINHIGQRTTAVINGRLQSATVVAHDSTVHVFGEQGSTVLEIVDPLAADGALEADAGSLAAPMPGKIVALLVGINTRVNRGTPLLVMEAMKMEHTIIAPADGQVSSFAYRAGDQVSEGAALLSFEKEPQ